jgi:hypothetical protein
MCLCDEIYRTIVWIMKKMINGDMTYVTRYKCEKCGDEWIDGE